MSDEGVIGTGEAGLERIRKELEGGTFNSIRRALPDEEIERACRESGHRYRRRLITPVVTVLHMIASALWPEASFKAGWHLLWDATASRLPEAAGRSPGSGSISKARNRLPLSMWRRLFSGVCERAAALSAPFAKWHGHRVVMMDGTCVSMADERALADAFGRAMTRDGPSRYPLARLVIVALANTMCVLDHALDPYGTDETRLGRELLRGLRPGDLLMADRRFAGAALYHLYTSLGLEFLTRIHQAIKMKSLRRLWDCGPGDFVAEMKIDPTYRRKDASLPATVRVRLIRVVLRSRGKREVTWLVTSLLDAKVYPARDIIELYARRWRVETLFRELKINLSTDILRSKTPEGVRKEVIARLTALNVLRMIVLEAAIKHGVDPLRISFINATRTVLLFAPALATEPFWKLLAIYRAMLAEIASHIVPLRPGRNEPRAVRRELRQYPLLRTTRQAWRLANVA